MKSILGTLVGVILTSSVLAETIWLDVRSSKEFQADHLVGSVHIPHTQINEMAGSKLLDKQATINVYCAAGYRAAKAKSALEDLGYENVVNIVSLEQARKLKQ